MVDDGSQPPDMERISEIMPACSRCNERGAIFKFSAVPGVYCFFCASLLRKELADDGKFDTWPFLVAASLEKQGE